MSAVARRETPSEILVGRIAAKLVELFGPAPADPVPTLAPGDRRASTLSAAEFMDALWLYRHDGHVLFYEADVVTECVTCGEIRWV